MKMLSRLYAWHLLDRGQRIVDGILRRPQPKRMRADCESLLKAVYGESEPGLSYRERLRQREIGLYSQNGEDGLLLYLFSQIGTTNKTLVEFGVESGRECNAANLLLHFGWNGLLMDGSEENMASGRRWYEAQGLEHIDRITLKQCFVTTENINGVISDSGISGEIDLLSIDIDGNDYWLWDAIEVINSRVVVVEYNSVFGPSRSMTVCYDPAFTRFSKHRSGWYHGASLSALAKLGERKGYALVGADSMGCNAFFVRQDVLRGDLDTMTPEEAFYAQPKRVRIAPQEQQFEMIRHLPFDEV